MVKPTDEKHAGQEPGGAAKESPGNHAKPSNAGASHGERNIRAALGAGGFCLGAIFGASVYVFVSWVVLRPPPDMPPSPRFSTAVKIFLHEAKRCVEGDSETPGDLEAYFEAIPAPRSDAVTEKEMYSLCKKVKVGLTAVLSKTDISERRESVCTVQTVYEVCVGFFAAGSYVNVDKARQDMERELTVDWQALRSR